MDYKKLYEEALKRAKAVINVSANQGETQAAIETIFPELAESEDERIRNGLIDFLDNVWHLGKDTDFDRWRKADFIDWIEWVRRQKEQKPVTKFKVGDKVRFKSDGVDILTITGLREDAYLTDSAYGPILFSDQDEWEIVEQKPVDEKIVDEVGKSVRKKWALDFINYIDANRPEGKMNVSNAECKDIEEAFFSADWEKIYKYYNKYLQKPAEWSEEDEKVIADSHEQLIRFADAWERGGLPDNADTVRKIASKLKSLRPQPHWKPSEAQMEALKDAKFYYGTSWVTKKQVALESLYEDLKKLM